jgi:hypothetical protein
MELTEELEVGVGARGRRRKVGVFEVEMPN